MGPILIILILLRAASGHGRELPCDTNTCTRAQFVAEARRTGSTLSVDLGPRPALAKVDVAAPVQEAKR